MIRLNAKLNTDAPDSEYPYGNIRDDDGSGNGTDVDTINHADFHQFFARLFGKSGMVSNDLPDNAYNGFQYYEAFEKLTRRFHEVNTITGTTALTAKVFNQLHVIQASGNAVITLPSASSSRDADILSFVSLCNFEISIVGAGSDTVSETILLLKSGDYVEVGLDKDNVNWVITKRRFEEKWRVIGDPGQPAFGSGVTNYGGSEAPASFYKDASGRVYLKGLVNVASGSSGGKTVFTLPSGYRPAEPLRFLLWFDLGSGTFSSFPSGNLIAVQVQTNGNVDIMDFEPLASPMTFDLAAIQFRAS